MKPLREHHQIEANRSWGLLWREIDSIPFIWHYHPEYELTLTLNCSGQRFIADQIATFEEGDLVLVCPNQPHTWYATQKVDETQPMLAIVLWFSRTWLTALGELIPEWGNMAQYLAKQEKGLVFSREAAKNIAQKMLTLNAQSEAEKTLTLISILSLLTEDKHATTVSTQPASPQIEAPRLQKVMDYLHTHFTEVLDIAHLAEMSALSAGGFHRLFKQSNACTPVEYQNRLRIGHACQQLISTNKPIALIAEEAGFSSLSYFNRLFKQMQKVTPFSFRKQFLNRRA
ncbi:AraC family transcriptional regulator [Leeia sp. TBRC 13508]|uniref:AraC family transcriptional regulator n=1 Tax=Leeia speluncae TaxID=2884804 RepID=A0ABS8D1K0_9NEIS|nr:AraC family transcriptional regulator [Leeia speluncae]MCB6182050.1 AraC family transcriptional regulator [Leeia speluncae]